MAVRLFSAIFICAAASAQSPAISPGGIVNAATFGSNSASAQLAPASIASVFGMHLAETTEAANGVPLPQSLAGVSVRFGGVAAPLFFVSPGQINMQVPVAVLPPGTTAQRIAVVVTTSQGDSTPEWVLVSRAAPGVFTLDRSGSGPGVIVNTAPDGSTASHSPATPARPGDYLTIYLTGLGSTSPPVADGVLSPGDPPAAAIELPLVAIGRRSLPVRYAGRTPGLVGLDQINVQLPADIGESCGHVLRIAAAGQASQAVPLFVRAAGSCE